MNSHNPAFHETASAALSHGICLAAMIVIFALTGNFDMTVLRGGIAGGLISLSNFLLMSLFANMAADKAAHHDVAEGRKLIQLSYMGRMAGIMIALVACAGSGYFHVLALALPLLFTGPILTIRELFRKKGGN